MKRVLLFFFLFSNLLASLPTKPPQNEAKMHQGIEVHPLLPKVNPISGEYVEEACDITVAGCHPLSAKRFYHNRFSPGPLYASWEYNPETSLKANFEYGRVVQNVMIGQRSGSFLLLDKREQDKFVFDGATQKGFVNTVLGEPSAHTNPRNFQVSYQKRCPGKNKDCFAFHGTVKDGSGRICEFYTAAHEWHKPRKVKNGDMIDPFYWTPYHLKIDKEHLPNGNIIRYTYKPYLKDDYFPRYYRLGSIELWNHDETKKMGRLDFEYDENDKDERDTRKITIKGSDGRKVVCHVQIKTKELMMDGNLYDACQLWLTKAESAFAPIVKYHYDTNGKLYLTEFPKKRLFKTDFNASNQVEAQWAPIGPKDEFKRVAHFTYDKESTTCFDAKDYKTKYCYDAHKRLVKIEHYDDRGALYSVERSVWDDESFLKEEIIEDASGKVFKKTTYTYDPRGNVEKEERSGIGDVKEVALRTFSEDGFNNLLTEEDGDGLKVVYAYKPGTNLCTSELTYAHGVLKKRLLREYDDCAICVKTIEDDGEKANYRKIIKVTPRYELPCFGLPECLEELTINENGQEILLSKITYQYAPFGKVLREDHYDGTGKKHFSVVNEYHPNELLKATTDGLGHRVEYEYDENHNVILVKGPCEGMSKRITYDLANRPTIIREECKEGGTLITTKDYDLCGRVVRETDESGFETRMDYDALGRLQLIAYPDGGVVRREYDVLGHLKRELDASGYLKTMKCDWKGNPIEISHPDKTVERFVYNTNGTLKEHHDRNGARHCFDYDEFKRVNHTRIYASDNKTVLKETSATYSTYTLKTSTDGEWNVTIYSYDKAGRKTEEKLGKRVTKFFYDALGRLYKTVVGESAYIEDFDVLNRVKEKRVETLSGEVLKRETYDYDEIGNRKSIKTSKGSATTEFNFQNLPMKKTDFDGNVTIFSYEYTGGLKCLEKDACGVIKETLYDGCRRVRERSVKNVSEQVIQKCEFSYDKMGNVIEEKHTVFDEAQPINVVTHLREYGPEKRLKRLLEAGVRATSYDYDQKGRLKKITKPNGEQLLHEYDDLGRLKRYGCRDFDYRYKYDGNDRLREVKDEVGHTHMLRNYDECGNVVVEQLTNGLLFRNDYDGEGRRRKIRFPDNSCVEYDYKGDQLLSIKRGKHVYTYTKRDLEGNIELAAYPGGSIQYDWKGGGRLKKMESPHYTAELTYDKVQNLKRCSFRDHLGGYVSNYSYDDLHQLIGEDKQTYHYDSLCNRLKKNDIHYVVNALNEIKSVGGSEYHYDTNGCLTSDGVYEYTYDVVGRLIGVKGHGAEIEYGYDAFDRRVYKTVNGVTERYLWDGENEVGLMKDEGVAELRVLGEGIGGEVGASVLIEVGDKTYIPISDFRGCIIAVLDESGGYVEGCRYDGYGVGGKLTKIPWSYCGKRYDKETGHSYFGKRYYSCELGRWLTPDPAGDGDGPNLYAYVHNSPLLNVDIYGLFSLPNGGMLDSFHLLDYMPMRLGKMHDYASFENHHSEKSRNFCLHQYGYKDLKNGTLTFGNGMRNTESNAVDSALHIAKLAGCNVYGTYNATGGIVSDVFEYLVNSFGMATPPVRLIQQQWDMHFERHPNSPLKHFCHSHGALQADLALNDYPENRRKLIHIAAFAPACYINPKKCAYVRHYVSWGRDIVPTLRQVGMALYKNHVEFLKPHPAAGLFDHNFDSPTYKEAIIFEIDNYLKEIGE